MDAKRERPRIDKDYHRLSERKERLRDTQRKRESVSRSQLPQLTEPVSIIDEGVILKLRRP